MKQLLLIFIFSFLFSLSASAQHFELGIKGGSSLVDVGVTSSPGSSEKPEIGKARLSYHLGAFANIDLNNKFYLQAELVYANKGFRSDAPNGNRANIHFHYLTIPILLNYKILDKLHLGIGGEFGYRLSARSKFENKSINAGGLYDNKINIGIDAGLKYKLSDVFNIGVRGIYGLTDVFKSPIKAGPETLKIRNRGIQVSLGYILFSGYK